MSWRPVQLEEVLRLAETDEANRLLGKFLVESTEVTSLLEAETARIAASFLDLTLSADRRPIPKSVRGGWVSGLLDRSLDDFLERMDRDARFREAASRFVEEFPEQRTAAEVMALMNKHFHQDGLEVPSLLRLALLSGPYAERAVAVLTRLGVEFTASRMICGSGLPHADRVLTELTRARFGFTADILGEEAKTLDEAEKGTRRYLELIRLLRSRHEEIVRLTGSPPEVSFKLSHLVPASQLRPEDPDSSFLAAQKNVTSVFALAKEMGVHATLDMERYGKRDLMVGIFKRILLLEPFRDWNGANIVVQAYLKDSKRHLLDLLEWVEERGTEIGIRLVKGAYHRYEVGHALAQRGDEQDIPVFLRIEDTHAQYELLTELLMKNARLVRIALAGHNPRSLSKGIAAAGHFGVDPKRWRFEFLIGLGNGIGRAAQMLPAKLSGSLTDGLRLLFYCPIIASGEDPQQRMELGGGMPYISRRLDETTSGDGILHLAFLASVPRELRQELLASPFDRMKDPRTEPVPDWYRRHDAFGKPVT